MISGNRCSISAVRCGRPFLWHHYPVVKKGEMTSCKITPQSSVSSTCARWAARTAIAALSTCCASHFLSPLRQIILSVGDENGRALRKKTGNLPVFLSPTGWISRPLLILIVIDYFSAVEVCLPLIFAIITYMPLRTTICVTITAVISITFWANKWISASSTTHSL